jgi:putative aldouronate transport system substrate-binding protein
MKKKWKLLIAIIMIVSILAACSSDKKEDEEQEKKAKQAASVDVNKEGFPIVDEPIELTMMAPGTGLQEWKDMETLKAYAEKTNVHFKYNTPPLNDFQTKLNLAFASEDVGDIIYGAGTNNLTPAMEVDYGEQGILIPLEDLIEEYAPNLKKLLDENPDVKRSITTLDGHIYSLPTVSVGPTSSWYRGPIWYNGEWLDALDVKELPKTTDEFYKLLKRFRDEDPNGNGEADEIPLIDVDMESTRPWLLGAFGMKEWGIEERDGKVRYTPMTDEYKAYLTYMNKLYKEKLLDSETFSQSDEQKKAKGQDDRVGAFPDFYSYFTTGQSEEEAFNNPMFYPLTSPESPEPIIPRNPAIQRGTFSITDSNPNPEASIRWIDYFYSDEGYAFLNMGPEGYLWEWEDEEGGDKKLLDTPDGFDSKEDYRATISPDYGISAPSLNGPIAGIEESDFEKFIEKETKEKIDPYAEVPFPLVYLSTEEQKKINNIEVDLQSYIEQMEAKFITGVEPLSNWDNYVDTIKKMNIDEYTTIYQDAYDRWKENN